MGWVIGVYVYSLIGMIFVIFTETYDDGFWEEFKVILLWPILGIIFGICCIYFGWKELYKKVKNS